MGESVMSYDWPHERCERWAEWARCPTPGAEGTSEGYLREALDKSYQGLEPGEEIAITDAAIARMKVSRKDYWRIFKRFYLTPGALSEYEIALDMSYTVERVTATIRQSLMLVGYHIHQVEKERAKPCTKGGFMNNQSISARSLA